MVIFSALIYLIVALLLLHFEIFDFSLESNGVSALVMVIGVLLMLLGSLVDVPLIPTESGDRRSGWRSLLLIENKPKIKKGIYLNIGGAVVPLALSAYLFFHTPIVPTLIALVGVTIMAKFLTRVSTFKGNWLHLSAAVPLLVALSLALLLTPANPAAVFYISGTLGVLLGAGLLNLDRARQAPLFIGGRGMFHGIFIVNIVFLLL